MGFIRVRQSKGPAHEFDISEAAYAQRKRAYVVIDKTPVGKPRPASYVAASAVKPQAAIKPAAKEGK